MIVQAIRKRGKFVSLISLFTWTFQILGTSASYALTSGPTQPEVQSFQPAGTSEMVDLFSGDFSYNIPLFELPGPNGGYPFNLSYQSGVSMDQEASWVGLGWNLQPGAITRQMRGLPDEFKGDPVYTKMSIRPNITVGLGVGASLEVFGKELGKLKSGEKGGSLTVGLSVYHNNYRGMGYTIDASVGFGKANSSGFTSSMGLNLSLDSQEGINVNPTLGLGTKMGVTGLGVGYNSQSGLSSLTISHDLNTYDKKKAKDVKRELTSNNLSFSSTLSFASVGYTPQVTMPMRSANISATFKAGGTLWGVFGSPYVTGFYNEQWLKDDKKRVRTDAYGYLHFQDFSGSSSITDLNREKEGMVSKETPNLPIPSLSYDIYSVAGQGISAMYRPMRNDYGIVHDPETSSVSISGGVGVDLGVGAGAHVGVNVSLAHAKSTSGLWTGNNQMHAARAFQKQNPNDLYEPVYFKVHGELSPENTDVINRLGGDNAVRVNLTTSKENPVATNNLEKEKNWNYPLLPNNTLNRERKSRSQVVQPITVGELVKNGEELMSQFKVNFIDEAGIEKRYSRTNRPAHHITAFVATTPDGLRYNYGIPAYNLVQEEVTFSAKKQAGEVSRVDAGNGGSGDPSYTHDNTDKFLKRVELPAYAHSHLLTSITGPDYVDVTGDGVTADDLGYWVKFTYKQTNSSANPYRWRDPFSRAHFQEGWKTDPRDDRGSFVYGEKEMYYLARAETKSHIASFEITERADGKGVAAKLQDTNTVGRSMYSLRQVSLYTRSAGSVLPIKVVKFSYDYTLCPNVYNNGTSGSGKLTLKKVWFEYGGSGRGSLNPYVFTYHDNNPGYDILTFDRWGTYKPYPNNRPYFNSDFPYAEQDPLKKTEIDRNAAAWSLTQIQLPSGGKIIVDYESDDYGYVQHKQAMQMVPIVNPYGDATNAEGQSAFNLDYENSRIRFKLESPITQTLTPQQEKDQALRYLDGDRKQLCFKIKINLLKPGKNAYEYIIGYADIDFTQPMGLEKVGGAYHYGFFHLKKEGGNHPFSVRAWQHLRTNQPDIAKSGTTLTATSEKSRRIGLIRGLASMVGEIRRMFGGFNRFCKAENYAKQMISGESWIRLNSPDKVKYGGGLRVRQISLKDNWAHNEEGVYGQVYEYTIREGNEEISSGVAAYEPLAGGEENPLRYAKKYVESVPLRADNNLFFEYPINESYYPGPQVGYRKVTVYSLASAYKAHKVVKNITLTDGNPLFPSGENIGYGTTGKTVHEFYTAKDFPVITEETSKVDRPFRFSLTLPFAGSVAISKLATSQGYSIITNDMHGKQKMVSNYRQDNSGNIENEPISWVKYNYFTTPRIYEKEKVQVVKNTFRENADGSLSIASSADVANGSVTKFNVGQEQELFVDMRQHEDNTWSGAGRYNVDALYVFIGVIPIPTYWPTIGKNFNQLRTATTNKIIFKTGIVESVEAFDGGSLVKTQNLKWDKQTGATLLTRVNNNFDAPVYSYTIPAYTQYQGMGAAYQNLGFAFSIQDVQRAEYEPTMYRFDPGVAKDKLFPGDEILLYNEGTSTNPVAKVIFIGEEKDELYFHSDDALSASSYQATIVRSGYRNQLGVSAENITALEDPSATGSSVTYSRTVIIPNEN